MSLDEILWSRLTYLVPLLLSLSVHEWAHAWSAMRLGDDTAARLGRLTMNPLAHIDALGTLLLPLLGVPFGWARPVPINPTRFRRNVSMRMAVLLTAAAGPLSNLGLAALCATLMGLAYRFSPMLLVAQPALAQLLQIGVFLNVVLALFNLLPIPPLDGSRIVDALMPDRGRPAWDAFGRYAPIALLAVIAAAVFLGPNVIAATLGWVSVLLARVTVLIAG
jgi:Zn-dependent protease